MSEVPALDFWRAAPGSGGKEQRFFSTTFAAPPLFPCRRPWIGCADSFRIHSYTALYLLVGPGYPILRSWKKRGSPLADRSVLKWEPIAKEKLLQKKIESIVPIPQRYERSWRLGRSPARSVAQWLSGEPGIPVFEALLCSSQKKSQASLSLRERIKNQIHFQLDDAFSSRLGNRILLVDDFMTTGHTLRAAARVLSLQGGAREIHTFCVGARPDLRYREDAGWHQKKDPCSR